MAIASTMSQLGESIALEQLANHNTLESLWIAVRGHVYDLTTFSSDHPGGIEALLSCAGTDGTESYDYAGHSESNMAKMQQYRVGRIAGSVEQDSTISHHSILVESTRIRSATSLLKQLRFPRWMKLATAISATSLVLALSYQRRASFVDYISPNTRISQLQPRASWDQTIRHAFWAGIAIASLVSCVGFGYLYKLFVASLDYQNEVFSFPPTIPRKTKR